MVKTLIVYYSTSEKGKVSNEDKVVLELEKLFTQKGFEVKKLPLQPTKKLDLDAQFKQEKELELKQTISHINDYEYIIIGSPLVGSITSSPLVNSFIRNLQKMPDGKTPKFALFVTGIIPGFGLKKMQSLLSMKGIKAKDSIAFTSMFEFDSKKMLEVDKFFEKVTSD